MPDNDKMKVIANILEEYLDKHTTCATQHSPMWGDVFEIGYEINKD